MSIYVRCLDPRLFGCVRSFGIFQNQVSRYTTWRASARRRAAAFPSPGREIQEGSWRSAAETRGIVPRKSPGEDLAARSAVCTRVMICGRPDRDPVRPAGWLAERRGHPRFPGTVRRVASAARKGER